MKTFKHHLVCAVMLATATLATALHAFTVEPDPQAEFEVISSGTYTGEVMTWVNSQSQRTYCTHIYRIRVPDGMRAIATLEYTHIDFLRDDWTTRGYVLSVYGEIIRSGTTSARRIYRKALYADANAIVQGWSYGPYACYQTIYYTLTVEFEEDTSAPNLTVSDTSYLSPSDPDSDDNITFRVCTENNGTRNASSGSVTRLWLDGKFLADVECGTIYTGSYNYSAANIKLKPLAAGQHTLKAVADANNAIRESDETDNSRTFTFTVGGGTPFWVRYDLAGGATIYPTYTNYCAEVSGKFYLPNATGLFRTGYNLKGWATTPGGDAVYRPGENVSDISPKRNEIVTFYAVWEPGETTRKLTLVSEGSSRYEDRTVNHGESIGELPAEDDLGRKIAGWATHDFHLSDVLGAVFVTPETKLAGWDSPYLYAIYSDDYSQEGQIKVTFAANGGTLTHCAELGLVPTSSGEYASVTNNIGDNIGKMPSAVRDGVACVGWTTSKDGGCFVQESDILAGGKSMYLYAYYGDDFTTTPPPSGTPPAAYVATFHRNYEYYYEYNGGIYHYHTIEYDAVTSIVEVANHYISSRDGYTFDGWFTAKQGGTKITASTPLRGDIEVYAHWSRNDGGEEEYPVEEEECAECIDFYNLPGGGGILPGGDPGSAWTASKAATMHGAVYDEFGSVVGIVQLKVAKPKANRKTGIVTAKISGTVTELGGKKKQLKAVTVEVPEDEPITANGIAVKLLGEMDVMIGDDGFSGTIGDWRVESAEIGGSWTNTDSSVTVDFSSGGLPDGTRETLLPNGEPVIAKSGKWAFAPAALVKWAKDRATGEYSLSVNTDKGKTNVSALKFSYAPKTGIYRGSFKIYAVQNNKLKKYTVKVSGLVVNGVGWGAATLSKPVPASWPVEVR